MALLPRIGGSLKGICDDTGKTDVQMLGMMAEAISLRSFSTLWYWIALAAFWLRALGHVMGLPYGMVNAARRRGGADVALLERAAQVQAQRRVDIWARGQVGIVAAHAFAFGMLAYLGFVHGVELALALFFFHAPLMALQTLNLRMARQVLGEKGQGDALLSLMFYFNIYTQFIAMAFILATVFTAFVYMAASGFLG